MTPQTATVVFVFGILGLLALDRDKKARTSKALWIPVAWLSIAGSRSVSEWLQIAPPNSGEAYLEGSPLDRNIWMGLLALAVIVLLARRQKVGKLLRANVPILLFYFYCAISILWSDYPDVAFKRWIKYVGDLAMVLVVLTDANRSAAVKRFLARVGFILVPVSILLIKYYSDLGRRYDDLTGTVMYTGVTVGKNILGSVCMIWGLSAVWRFLQEFRGHGRARRTWSLVAQGTLLGMALWLFWRADAMTSLSCFLMASALLVATSIPALARKRWVVHVLAAVILFVPLTVLYFDVSSSALEAMGRDSTLTGRTEIWHDVIGMTPSPMFGAGFESFWLGPRLLKIWSMHWWHPNEAHNGYIEIYLNLGWVGVALLGVVLVTGYRNAVVAFRRDAEVGRLGLAYFVVGVVFNFTEAAFKTLSPIWIMFLLATIAVPKASASALAPPIRVDRQDTVAECEPQVEHVL